MCNLYRLKSSAAAVAALFDVSAVITQFNTPEESYPGTQGLVVREQADWSRSHGKLLHKEATLGHIAEMQINCHEDTI